MNRGPKHEQTGKRIRLISGIRDLGGWKGGVTYARSKVDPTAPGRFVRQRMRNKENERKAMQAGSELRGGFGEESH